MKIGVNVFMLRVRPWNPEGTLTLQIKMRTNRGPWNNSNRARERQYGILTIIPVYYSFTLAPAQCTRPADHFAFWPSVCGKPSLPSCKRIV